ncbi:hypothetical protein [Thalassotalea ganghwensis]
MKEHISEQALDQQVQQLDKEMSPSRDLWPGIEKALARQQHQRDTTNKATSFPGVAWAASVVAAVLLTWGVINSNPVGDNQSPTLAVKMEQDFEKTKQLLLTSYGQEVNTPLTPELEKQFEELAKARAALAKSLEKDPNNSDLLNLLRWTQQQELSLLQTIYSPKWQSI